MAFTITALKMETSAAWTSAVVIVTEMKIEKYPSPILKKRTDAVTEFGDHLYKLTDEMHGFMKDSHGVGLAANQVGLNMRVFTMEVGDTKRTMVNPEIVDGSGQVYFPESCLSFPGIVKKVQRKYKVKVWFQDPAGRVHKEWFEGLPAVCIQHELDHLDGKTFLEHMPRSARRMIESIMKKQKDK